MLRDMLAVCVRAFCSAHCLEVTNLHSRDKSRTPASAIKYIARAFFSPCGFFGFWVFPLIGLPPSSVSLVPFPLCTPLLLWERRLWLSV